MSLLHFEQTGPASGRILDGSEPVAEIRDLRLCRLRLAPGGRTIIGEDVPLPLYWQQYAHHEDPTRNAGSMGRVELLPGNESRLVLRCEGSNALRQIRSVYTLEIAFDLPTRSYLLDIHAQLEVLPGMNWLVTHNPSHGELEFCNFWPEGTFFPQPGRPKAYSACFVDRGPHVTLIPHHHLESSDKHNIQLRKGDRFGWLLEDENPVVQLLSDEEASAGLCAYMWDAHIAYRCCATAGAVALPSGTCREASFRITRLSKHEAADLLQRGVLATPPELETTPVYVRGLNTFRETIRSFPGRQESVWPWTFELPDGDEADIRGMMERGTGYDDAAALCVMTDRAAIARWVATTLGPAFGEPPFTDGKRYRLSAMVRTASLQGTARIGVRMHREGSPGLGDTSLYEHFWSINSCSGTASWTSLQVITPPISPPPDRVHLLLHHEGRGSSWFDNVLFQENE